MSKKFLIIGFAVPILVALDQWTKWLIDTSFRWGESLVVIERFFALTYVRNTGAAFGMLQRAPNWFRGPFFIAIPIIALVVIMVILKRLKEDQRWTIWALTLILSGAIGNLIDRVRFGYVIDFLDFHWDEVYHWPAFNVADSCIVVGVGILFILSLFEKKRNI